MDTKNLSGHTTQTNWHKLKHSGFVRRFWVAKLFVFALFFTNKLIAQTITVDGNPGDWPAVLASNPLSTHILDPLNSSTDDVWTGGSQNVDPISGWHWTHSNTQDKTDIGNAGIALIGHKIYVFADLYATNGDAAIGFWVLKQNVQEDTATGGFTGAHQVGDLLIGIAFSGGGATATTIISKWNGTGLDTINLTTSAANAATNTTTVSVPASWSYTPKTGPSGIYPNTSFFEAFVDLDSINIVADPCFSSFTVLTWSSQSIHASLADLTQGTFFTKPQVTVANDTVCAGATAVFTANVTGGLSPFTYSWNGGAFASTNTFTVSPATTSGIVRVTAQGSNGCLSEPDTAHLEVKPSPGVNPVSNATYCNRDAGAAINFTSSTAGATFAWSGTTNVGFGTSGTGSIGTYTATNSGAAAITTTVTVTSTAGGCPGTPLKFTVTVNPTPTVDSIGNATYCNGDAAAAINFTGGVSGTAFNWTATSNVGFGSSGSTNIAAYAATNGGTSAITTTVTVTPSANGCTGAARKFVITVNPTPKVDSIGNATYCAGASAAGINFSGPIGGTTFAWSGSANVGFGTSGTTNIAPYTALNGGSTPVVDVVTVTPTANSCTGAARTFTVTVNPNPGANAPVANDVLCNGAASTAIPLTGLDTSTHYSWTSNVDLGFGTSGTDSIPSFTGHNSGAIADTATITVTATSGAGCSGTATTGFLIVINPSPAANAPVSNISVCQGATVPSIVFLGLDPTITYNWKATSNVGFGLTGIDSIHTFIATGAPVTATVTVKSTSANGCPGDSTGFTITVNPIPTVTARDTFTCVGVSVPLRGSPAGGTWTGPGVSGSNFTIGSIGTYTVVYHYSNGGGCTDSARARVTVTNCGGAFGAYTQGYYGGNGKSCGGPLSSGKYNNPTALLTYLLSSGTMYVGRSGREIIIPATAASILNAVMPGGSTPRMLSVASNVTISNSAGSVFATNYLTGGRINNVFLAQTIAIKLADRLSGLGSFPIQYSTSGDSWFQTQQVSTSDCKNFTPAPCSADSFKVSQTVARYLTHAGSVSASVTDLISLADDLLGGVRTPGTTFGGYVVPTYSQVNDAIDGIIHAFDGWKFFSGSYGTNLDAGCGSKPMPSAPVSGEQFKVYPNPNTGTFDVEIPSIATDATVTIMDINGRAVTSQVISASNNVQKVHFDLSAASHGMYFVHMISGDQEYAAKVLIQ